jgi:hypothetical protein
MQQTRQQAFRERKDQHVKTLESEVARLKIAHQKLAAENNLLTKEIENISALIPPLSSLAICCNCVSRQVPASVSRGCQTDNASDNGDCFYSAGAAWDFIINHRLYDETNVNVDKLITDLKYRAHSYVCGPLFTKNAIIDTLRQSLEYKSGGLSL